MITFRYSPPKRDARLVLAAAGVGAVRGAAELVLAASQPLVPVEHGDLKASGRVEQEGLHARIIYDATSKSDGYAYSIRQHERTDFHHPNGGQAHFLIVPMHQEAHAAAALMAAALRAAL